MNTKADDTGKLPGDLATALEQIRERSIPLARALEYASRRAADAEAAASEIRGWTDTRDLLTAVSERYQGVARILQGLQPGPVPRNDGLDAAKLSEHLRPVEHIIAGWKQLTTGKQQATDQTADIWVTVLSSGERLSPENQQMFATFAADRNDLEVAGDRLRLALEYLWRNGRPQPGRSE